MKSVFILLGLAAPCLLLSQPGFNITPDFGYPRDHFRNLIVHNDTIVCYGMARKDTVAYQQCLFLARFDSSGVPIDSKLICDSLGGTLTMAINWSDIVTTSDGGYAITAASFDRYDGIFIKLRHDLSVEFIQEYPDSVNLVEFYNSIVVLPDGYLLGGHLQRPNYLQDGFLRRVDKQGNSIWFSYYGEYDVFDLFTSYYKLSDSLIIYTGSYEKNPNTVNGRGPWLNLINPDGEVIKEWRPDDNTVPIDGVLNLLPASASAWIIYGMNVVSGPNPFKYQPYIARLDTNFQIEAVRPFDQVRPVLNFLRDFEPTLDGNFIGAGQFTAINPNIEPDIYGRLFKFSPNLDSLWSLKLTAPIPNVQQSGNYLGGVGVLSSGNMVAGGYSHSGNDIYCWLVKFSPDGCVDTIWCPTTPAWEPVEMEMREQEKVWPNPANDFLFVEMPKQMKSAKLSLFALDGRLVLQQKISESGPVEVSRIPQGIYLCRILDDIGNQFNVRLIISR